jgi:hypothetical protein
MGREEKGEVGEIKKNKRETNFKEKKKCNIL